MKRTVSLKLINPPNGELQATAEAFRDACQLVIETVKADDLPADSQIIQKATYWDLTSLPSNMRCSAARIATGAWKSWKGNGFTGELPRFRRPFVSCGYRNDWNLVGDGVSLRTLNRRIRLDYVTSPLGRIRLQVAKKNKGLHGAKLIKRKGDWFLDVLVILPGPAKLDPQTPIGVDRGITYLAVARAPDRRPLVISGKKVKDYREYHSRLRRRLQAKGTRSSKRLLRQLSGKEKRYVLNEMRNSAKLIILYALAFSGPVLILEKLTGIQTGNARRWGRKQRYLLNTWAYKVLRHCLEIQAEEHGVQVIFVNPAWSSRTCPRCGDARKENRIGIDYHCKYCGYRNHADVVGATNLARLWLHRHAGQPRGPANGPDECRGEGLLVNSDLTLKSPANAGAVGIPTPTLPR